MARRKRYHGTGCFYHVILKGNHGKDIFFSDRDRYSMLYLMQEGVERFEHQIHAYCFMDNHVHLLIQVGEISLSKIIQNISFRYSQKINRRNKTVGHLFQGRFKAILVQDEKYFKQLLRYIHRNPVRAGMTNTPEEYPWSSHNAFIQQSKISWLNSDYALSRFSSDRGEAIALYSAYAHQIESPAELDVLRSNFKDGQVLGDDEFLKTIRTKQRKLFNKPLSLEAIIDAICDEFCIDKEQVISSSKLHKVAYARAMISAIAVDEGKVSLIKIAERMDRSPSNISMIVSRFNEKSRYSEKIQKDISRIKTKALKIATHEHITSDPQI